MRYREFSINIPINIRFGDNGEISVDTDNGSENDKEIMVPPLQQKIELAKAGLGKQSRVASELLQDEILDENKDQED
jgi:hypothetical protein